MNKKDQFETNKETVQPMAANGTVILPDGKSTLLPSAVDFSINNKMRSMLPTTRAAAASAYPNQTMPSNASVPEENEQEGNEEEEDDENEEDEAMEENFKVKFKDALVSLLGESANPELVSQIEAIFEAAVQDRVENNLTHILEEVDSNVKNYLTDVTNNLVEKVDDYLDYVVEEWMTENTLAVEQGIKTQIAENFINGLKNLFENHYIDVPAEKYNVLDELYAQNKELQDQLNSAINESIALKKEVSLTECAGIFVAETKDLADTQVARLQSLMENVSFESPEEYRNKLVAIKNNYLTSLRPVPIKMINEEQTFSKVVSSPTTLVEGYVNALGKLNKKI